MRGLKELHEMSVQRQIEKGETIRPTSSYRIDVEDDKEQYLEKLISDSGRSAGYTKGLIQDMDCQIKEV